MLDSMAAQFAPGCQWLVVGRLIGSCQKVPDESLRAVHGAPYALDPVPALGLHGVSTNDSYSHSADKPADLLAHAAKKASPTTIREKQDSKAQTPAAFSYAIESMHSARLRSELSLGTIRPPQRLAPFSHAIGLEVDKAGDLEDLDTVPTNSDGDAFGRLILLHDPGAEEAWEGSMRLVAYIQADMDSAVASDPLLPDVAWEWLTESLEECSAGHTNLGGTVTATASVRFGEIGGPPRAHQLEMRASWTAEGIELAAHVEAFGKVLANVAGLPPEGVTEIGS